MLTPLLYRLLARCPWLVYAITPLSLEAYEVLTVSGIDLAVLSRLFPMWLLFYVVGLDWKRWRDRLHGKSGGGCSLRSARVWRFSSLAASRGFGSAITIWRTTQLKLSSVATSLCVIAVIMLLPASGKRWLSESFLADVGDAFFGIYLCHMFVLAVVRKALAFFVFPPVLGTVLLWLLTLIFSFAFCALVRKGAPRRVAKLLGMS